MRVTDLDQTSFNSESSGSTIRSFQIAEADAGQRLDLFLSKQPALDDQSRSSIQHLVRQGLTQVNGQVQKTGYRVKIGDRIEVDVPSAAPSQLIPENVPFDIIHQDDAIIVLSKPPGLVVHPAAGHWSGTLVHGLLHRCPELGGLVDAQRPGLVHRLDKDTSGVMVVAKNDRALRFLVSQFKQRKVDKVYHAIVDGVPRSLEGRIDMPIGRHPRKRKKMAVVERSGRRAITNWQVIEELDQGFTYVAIGLETGRTHQIRVHMTMQGHPVAGDRVYGKKNRAYETLGITRQCLHSYELAFHHPETEAWMKFTAPLYPDMEKVLDQLRIKTVR